MLSIRLKRIGRKKKPFYNIIVSEKLCFIKGKYLEKLGYFDPYKNYTESKINITRINYWINNGATISRKIKFLLNNLKKV